MWTSMSMDRLAGLLQTLGVASALGDTAEGADPDPSDPDPDPDDQSDDQGTVVGVTLPNGQQATLDFSSIDSDAVDTDTIETAVERHGGTVEATDYVQGQADDGSVIPVSTEGDDLDLSDTYFDDEAFEFDFISDPRVQDVRDRQIEYNQRVGRWIMHKDDLVPSIKERIRGLILGESGLQVEPEDPDDDGDQRLADHLQEKYDGKSDLGPAVDPDRVINDMLSQNMMNARWVGRATDLRYLDLSDLELVVDGDTGERIFVQDATDYTTFDVQENADGDGGDDIDFDLTQSEPQALKAGDEVLEARLYDKPPLESVVDDVVGKMEMKFLKARKAQISSVGGLYIKVEPPEYLPEQSYFDRVEHPDDSDKSVTKLERELQQGLDQAFETLQDYKSGTVMSVPANWTVEQVELPEGGESMDSQIRGYNQAIARRLLYPLDLVELKSGAELSRETLMRSVINTLQAWRNEILSVFDRFADVQAEMHDIDGHVTHKFPSFRNEDEELLITALKYAGPAGMTESEIRQALNNLEGLDLDTDRDTSGMPSAGGPAGDRPQQPPGTQDGPETDTDDTEARDFERTDDVEAYTPPDGLDLYELDGWDQTSVWDAYLSVGGSHTSCVTEMTGELRNPDAWCAALKDQALGTDLWRKGSGAEPEHGLQGGRACRCWAADPRTAETTASLSDVADAVADAIDGLDELQAEDDYVAFSRGGTDPAEDDDFEPVTVVSAGDGQYDFVGLDDDEVQRVMDLLSDAEAADGSGPFSMVPDVPDDPDRIDRDMLERVAKWKLRQMKGGAEAGFSRSYNPSLHPRDPETGQFIERPFSIVDDLSELSTDSIENANTSEVVQFLHEAPGEPDMDAILQDDGVSIDGIPDDVDSVSELDTRSTAPSQDADVATNPKPWQELQQGDVISGPDGPVRIDQNQYWPGADGDKLTVTGTDGETSWLDPDVLSRGTADVYDVDTLSDMPSAGPSPATLDPDDPGFSDDVPIDKVEKGDVVVINEAGTDNRFVATKTSSGSMPPVEFEDENGNTVEVSPGTTFTYESKYVTVSSDPTDTDGVDWQTGDDVETVDLLDMDGTPAERREALRPEITDTELTGDMIRDREIPEGAYIGQDYKGVERFYKVKRYYEVGDTTRMKLEAASGNATSKSVMPSDMNGGYRVATAPDEPDLTLPDWSDDPYERRDVIRGALDDVLPQGDDAPDGNKDGPIDDSDFDDAKDETAQVLAQSADKEHVETVLSRFTSISDDLSRAHAVSNVKGPAPTAYTAVKSNMSRDTVAHELGHIVGDTYEYVGGLNDKDGETYPITNFSSQDDLLGDYGLKARPGMDQYRDTSVKANRDGFGEDMWADEVDEQVGTGLDGRNFTKITDPNNLDDAEMLYLKDPPAHQEGRALDIVEVRNENPGMERNLTLEDKDGNQHEARATATSGGVRVRWSNDESDYWGSNSVQGTRKSGPPDNWKPTDPDPEEILTREPPRDGSTQDRMDELANQVNKAWYRQARAGQEMTDNEAAAYTIMNGYSSKQAHETMSRIHQVMRPGQADDKVLNAAETLVTKHPGLLQAYRGVYDLPDKHVMAINEVLDRKGIDVSLDTSDVDPAVQAYMQTKAAAKFGGDD